MTDKTLDERLKERSDELYGYGWTYIDVTKDTPKLLVEAEAELKALRAQVATMRGALQVLVACEGGSWHPERYERERQEALAKAKAALSAPAPEDKKAGVEWPADPARAIYELTSRFTHDEKMAFNALIHAANERADRKDTALATLLVNIQSFNWVAKDGKSKEERAAEFLEHIQDYCHQFSDIAAPALASLDGSNEG